jgi:predicted O-methyltransferase YrrM
MSESTIDPRVLTVLREYEAREQRENELMQTLSDEEQGRRRDEMLLPVGPATGLLLNLLIKESGARRILEVGSSYGYSTVWLADAARATSGHVTSLELVAAKTEYGGAQLARVGLREYVQFEIGDALASLERLPGPFDFALIDLWKNLYVPVFELLHPKLTPGAIIVADNMLKPLGVRPQAQAYRERVRAAAGMTSVLLPVGNGLEVSRFRSG